MANRLDHDAQITPELLLRAYACGIFPMAESADDTFLHWIEPKWRGVIPLDGLHVSSSLAKLIRGDRFEIVANRNFGAVVDGCAAPAEGREKTWINQRIRALYGALHESGHCHSIEAYRNGELAGGLYGVSLGAAFFGESMFHRERDASKVALVHLVARLRMGGFRLLDTQFVTPHLQSLGAVEISRSAYLGRLSAALGATAQFDAFPPDRPLAGAQALAMATRGKAD